MCKQTVNSCYLWYLSKTQADLSQSHFLEQALNFFILMLKQQPLLSYILIRPRKVLKKRNVF